MFTLPRDFEAAHALLAQQLDRYRQPAAGDMHAGEATRPASVLVPLILGETPSILFTRRTEHLSRHAGQISFPGGRNDPGETAEQAALRETHEEIGLHPSAVRTVGRLSPYVTVSQFQVTPVIGLVQPGFSLALQADEVAEAFEVPLAYLLDRRHYHDYVISTPQHRTSRAITWQDRVIWGATAGMLWMLVNTLSPERPLQERTE